jgi:hypothetical protein
MVPESSSQVAQTGEAGSKTPTASTQQCPISSRACFNTRQVCNRKQLVKKLIKCQRGLVMGVQIPITRICIVGAVEHLSVTMRDVQGLMINKS